MKSNPLLKWLLIPMALVLVFVGIKLFSGERSARPAPPGSANPLTPEEMKALGIEGDTPRDTVATLVAQVKQLRNELQTALNDNKNQKTENERMRARESAIDQRIQSALDGERGRLQQDREQLAGDRQQTQGLLQDLQRRLDGLSGKSGQADLPVGLGLEEGDGKGFGGNQGGSARNTNGTRWVEPDDAKPSAKNGSSGGLNFPTSFGPAQKTLSDTADGVASTVADAGSRAVGASSKPVYTVPSNSTLMGSIAMTALIGRVPIDGTVNDPYPFKVLIGPDNLTANGIDIPDVAGAVVSGTASGDWTLSCVRGQIRSVLAKDDSGTVVGHMATIRPWFESIPNDIAALAPTSVEIGLSIVHPGHRGQKLQTAIGLACLMNEQQANPRLANIFAKCESYPNRSHRISGSSNVIEK